MGRKNNRVPETEARGGDKVDWGSVRAGEPLPEMEPELYPEPDSGDFPASAGSLPEESA